ncbi:hypothetical protein [Methylophaga thalassica]|nr:hypothetical protein [Methylophaga aminisulfidivorans]
MNKSVGHFNNKNSKALFFRNKTVAHNELSPKIDWNDVDKDIHLLSRIWSVLSMWSSHGNIGLFYDSKAAFLGFENILSQQDIVELIQKRKLYLGFVEDWFVSSLLDGRRVGDRTPEVKLHIHTSDIENT